MKKNEYEGVPVDIVITCEEDAYKYLELAKNGNLPTYRKLIFDGWPTLSIYLKGDKFEQSITPTVMRGLLDFQKGVYQSYASAKYSSPTKRLTEEEKRALEIRVDVNPGSSDYGINFQEIALNFVQQLGGKMDQTHLLITVVSVAVLFFGTSAFKSWLENKKEIHIKEISDETQRRTLEMLKFAGEQETARSKLMTEIITKDYRIENIDRLAFDARNEVLKTLKAGDSGAIHGVSVSPELAESLTRNARRKSNEVRLDGLYRLVKLDWTDPLKFKVKVFGLDNGLQLDAEVQDDSLTGKYKEALKEAEWSRSPVKLKINAKLIGEDEYKDAVVVSAEKHLQNNH